MADARRLSVRALRFGYPGCASFLGPVEFDLAPGVMHGVVGPNGAGKSTLARLVVGLLEPREGAIKLAGEPLKDMNWRRRSRLAGFLPQHLETPDELTAREVVLLGRYPWRRMRFFDSDEDHAVADRALRTTDAVEFADRTLDTLSGGERQRVHLAAALAGEPELLVLDEPTAALDPYHQLRIFSILQRLCREDGMSVLVVTHDLNLAGQFCDTVLLLDGGEVAAVGAAGEVLRTDVLERVYRVGFRSVGADSTNQRWIVPVRSEPADERDLR